MVGGCNLISSDPSAFMCLRTPFCSFFFSLICIFPSLSLRSSFLSLSVYLVFYSLLSSIPHFSTFRSISPSSFSLRVRFCHKYSSPLTPGGKNWWQQGMFSSATHERHQGRATSKVPVIASDRQHPLR